MTDLATLTAQLDAITRSLAEVPGRTPQDRQLALHLVNLASITVFNTCYGGNGASPEARQMMEILSRHGADPLEYEALATAMAALALRLGAWLGRPPDAR